MKNKNIVIIVSIIIIVLTYFIPIRKEIEKDYNWHILSSDGVGTSYATTEYVENYYNIYNIKIFRKNI